MFSATKELSFAFAHRLVGHSGKCRFLHGHTARVLVRVEAASLDDLGMAVDFSDIKDKAGRLLEEWDHSCLLEASDPLCDLLEANGQRVFRLAGPPTAEYLARAVYMTAALRGLPVAEVVFYETPTSFASFRIGRGE